MLPDKYLEELEALERRQRNSFKLLSLGLFIPTAVLFGPLLHEASHIGVLYLHNCSANISWNYSLTGLKAVIQPLCSLETPSLVFFYVSGYLVQFCTGLMLCARGIRGTEKPGKVVHAALGTGLLVSVVLSLGFEGDLFNLVNILGLPSYAGFLGTVVLLTLSLGLAAFTAEKVLLDLKRE